MNPPIDRHGDLNLDERRIDAPRYKKVLDNLKGCKEPSDST